MKKNFLLMLVSLVLFAACNNDKKDESADKKTDDQKTAGDKMNSATEKAERNKKTALMSMEAFSAHNADDVLKDAASDVVDYGDGVRKSAKGVDSIKVGMKAWMAAFPDVKGENLKAVAEGDWVVIWGEWSGTWKGDFMGQKATGKSYKLSDADIFKFNDEGKVVEHYSVQSPITVAAQVGMKMK